MIKPNAKLVYVAGPYSCGDRRANIEAACAAGREIRDLGHVPFIPHLNHYEDELHPRPYEDWLEADLVLIRRCDCVFRIPGHSPGADKEVAEAAKANIPVFYLMLELGEFLAQ